MLRTDEPYEQKRSYSLIKYKKFHDSEFEIISAEADKEGGVVWEVIIPHPTKAITCKVRPMGDLAQRREWYSNAEKFINKLLKVKYQGYNKYGNLEFPVGVELDRTDV
mgnify:CR=1 FL=1